MLEAYDYEQDLKKQKLMYIEIEKQRVKRDEEKLKRMRDESKRLLEKYNSTITV